MVIALQDVTADIITMTMDSAESMTADPGKTPLEKEKEKPQLMVRLSCLFLRQHPPKSMVIFDKPSTPDVWATAQGSRAQRVCADGAPYSSAYATFDQLSWSPHTLADTPGTRQHQDWGCSRAAGHVHLH